jgi:hypothetical protein
MPTPEKIVKDALRVECESKGGLFRYIQYVANLPGCPDCFCLLPGNRFVFVEAKAARGRLSPAQEKEIRAFAKRGAVVPVPHSVEEVKGIFDGV